MSVPPTEMLPLPDVVQAGREIAERRLSRARLADERGRRPFGNREADVLERPRVVLVAEPHMVEDDVAGRRGGRAPGFSSMSIGWSRYSKIRSKSASDVCTSRLTPSSEPTGKKAASAAP